MHRNLHIFHFKYLMILFLNYTLIKLEKIIIKEFSENKKE